MSRALSSAETLNPQQRKAVNIKNGSILVIAGAGSGKTRIITHRIAHLIAQHKVDPLSIVALTFTNKAAKEMKERVVSLLKHDRLPFIGTFHAYCLFLLKQNKHLLEQPFFSIMDEDDKHKLLNIIIKKAGLKQKISAKKVAYQISLLKNSLSTEQDFSKQDKMLWQIYTLYEQQRKSSHCFDFDDLLVQVLQLCKKRTFKQSLHDTIAHVLVDEYQDTNQVQHALLKHIALKKNKLTIDSVCAVGDQDQSIYSWRGATVENINHFKKDFPKTEIITVEQNYRSVSPILTTANAVIKNNPDRVPKSLWSERDAQDRVRVLSCFSEHHEATAIAHCIEACHAHKRSSIAVLYRTHFQSRIIEEALVRRSIPYKIIGGVQFYERKEIKDILAYTRLMANPFDRASFFRIINCPTRGLGAKFEELFFERWSKEPFCSFDQIILKLIKEKKVTGQKKTSLTQFLSYFKTFGPTSTMKKAINHCVTATGYLDYLYNQYDRPEAQSRIDNIQELVRAVDYFAGQDLVSIEQVLQEIALLAEHTPEKEKKNPVFLMTLHAAKGLEFDTIIIPGLQEDLLPSKRAITDAEVQEERRLLYVGITRAKEYLLFTYPHYRYRYDSTDKSVPSRFLDEIPYETKKDDTNYWRDEEFSLYFSDWMDRSVKTQQVRPARVIKSVKTGQKKTRLGNSSWRLYQPIRHNTFGIGTIKKIETKKNGNVYLTITFKSGTKKIAASFAKPL